MRLDRPGTAALVAFAFFCAWTLPITAAIWLGVRHSSWPPLISVTILQVGVAFLSLPRPQATVFSVTMTFANVLQQIFRIHVVDDWLAGAAGGGVALVVGFLLNRILLHKPKQQAPS